MRLGLRVYAYTLTPFQRLLLLMATLTDVPIAIAMQYMVYVGLTVH